MIDLIFLLQFAIWQLAMSFEKQIEAFIKKTQKKLNTTTGKVLEDFNTRIFLENGEATHPIRSGQAINSWNITANTSVVSYRAYPEDELEELEESLKQIIREAKYSEVDKATKSFIGKDIYYTAGVDYMGELEDGKSQRFAPDGWLRKAAFEVSIKYA